MAASLQPMSYIQLNKWWCQGPISESLHFGRTPRFKTCVFLNILGTAIRRSGTISEWLLTSDVDLLYNDFTTSHFSNNEARLPGAYYNSLWPLHELWIAIRYTTINTYTSITNDTRLMTDQQNNLYLLALKLSLRRYGPVYRAKIIRIMMNHFVNSRITLENESKRWLPLWSRHGEQTNVVKRCDFWKVKRRLTNINNDHTYFPNNITHYQNE